jgi:hypothetical protein
VSIEPLGSQPRVNYYANVAAIIGAVVTVLVVVLGGFSVYVVSRTQTEDNQSDTSRRLTDIQSRFDEQAKDIRNIEDRLARIEEGNNNTRDAIAALKVQITPKHGQ